MPDQQPLIAQVDQRITQARGLIQNLLNDNPGLTAMEAKRLFQIAIELLPTDRYQTPSVPGNEPQR